MLEIAMGPARSGKLRQGLERFCREVKAGREATAMWLVPSRDLARSLRLRVAEKLGGLAEPKILTLDDLARWIFESAGTGLKLLSDVERHLLLLEVLEKTRDPQLAAARGEPGFARVIGRAVDELKENLQWPPRESLPFAREYDAMLKSHGAVDRKSMAAEAVRRLRGDGEFFRTNGVTQLLIYGFSSFSPLEWELVQAAVKLVPSWVSLTADPAQPELFAESLETARRFESLFPKAKREMLRGAATAASIRLVSFSQHDRELEWIARECKRLCSEEKFSPDEIAVVSGAGGATAWWVRQVFRRMGLAVQSFSPETWEDQPVLRQGESPSTPELEAMTRLPEEEAQGHFSALEQWQTARRELERHPLFGKHGAAALRQLRFAPPKLAVPAIHFYGAEAPPLESYRAVFVSHFLEQSFPRPVAYDLFAASPLVEAEEHRRRERLAFYTLATRANEKLILCASKKDFQDQESLPSLYVKEWELFFPGVTAPAWEKGREEAPLLAGNPVPGVAAVTEMQAFFARQKQAKVADPRILEELRRKLTEKGSITQIEEFAQCAFRHFARKIMRLEEPEEGVTPLWIGRVAHAVLAAVGQQQLLDGDSESALAEAIDREIDVAFQETPDGATAGEMALEKETLRRQLQAFARQERQRLREEGWHPLYFEKGFGDEAESLYLLAAASDLQLAMKGRIDRIDVTADGKTAMVVDYKLGETPAKKEMKDGTSLQLQCYLDVAEKGLGLLPVEGRYLSLRGSGDRKIFPKELRDYLAAAREHLKRHALAIITGNIAAVATPEECRNCGFRVVCRTDEEI